MNKYTNTDRPGPDKPQPVIEEIRIKHFYDQDPDTSWLENHPKRLAAYQASEFCFIGIRASAQVSYPTHGGCRRLEWLDSSGIWGVESDSGPDYIRELEHEELADLKHHLAQFAVDVSDFEDKSPALHGDLMI